MEFTDRIESLRPTLMNLTRKFNVDIADAEDLIQDTVLKALSNREKFKEDINLTGWLFTIMRNIFINNQRKLSTANTVYDNSDNFYLLSQKEVHTFRLPDSKLEYAQIDNTIAKIKSKYLEPFRMYVEGFKYNEIANQLNIPIGTVKARIFKARKELKSRLVEYS